MARFENIEELADALLDCGAQDLYGVVCLADGFARNWGFHDATLGEARSRARELRGSYGVDFRGVILRVTPRMIRTTG